MTNKIKKNINYAIILLAIIGLSVGFSAFQKQLFISDTKMNVRLQENVRVSNVTVEKSYGSAISNLEDFNINRLYGNITLPETNSYILYKVDLSNYGNVKSGLLNIVNNENNTNFQICDANGSNCTNNIKTPICNGNNCTLGITKEIYIKLGSNTAGSKNVDLTFDFEPYNTITYTNFSENTSSFESEILSHDTYLVTFTSKPEQVDISGSVTYEYNKNTGVLSISDVNSNINIHAKYLLNDVAETSYSGSDPDNYVRFNNTLYRIITKENINDGSGNTELRTKITSDSSIGNYAFDSTTNVFEDSTLYSTLNTTYYNTLDNASKDLVDDAAWLYYTETNGNSGMVNATDFNKYNAKKMSYTIQNGNTTNYYSVVQLALINTTDYNNNSSWLNKDQFTINPFLSSGGGGMVSNFELDNKYFKIEHYNYKNSKLIPNKLFDATSGKVYSILNGEINISDIDDEMATYPTAYLVTDALITGGNGNRNNPYTLEKSNNGLRTNPTVISARTLIMNSTAQELVTVTNKVGTVYYSMTTLLTSSNYTSGSTSIPTGTGVSTYRIFYYIPEGNGYKQKIGYVDSRINGITYNINYQKGANADAIGYNADSCTTRETNTYCTVKLPSITSYGGGTIIGWSTTNGDSTGSLPGTYYELNANNTGVTLYANVNLEHNYQNTTTLAYYQTLKAALERVENNQTIKVLQDATETVLPVSEKENIKLDLNGKTISSDGLTYLEVRNSLDIYNTSSTTGYVNMNVYVSKSGSYTGTLTLNGTSNTNSIVLESLNIQGNANIYANITIAKTVNSTTAVVNVISTGIVNIYGGHIKSLGNSSTATIHNDGQLTIIDGLIESEVDDNSAIINQVNGRLTIKGGHVKGLYRAITNYHILTLGEDNASVSTTTPIIEGTGSSSKGIVNNNGEDTGYLYFYDGIVKSSGGTGTSILGNNVNTPTGYGVYKSTTSGIESAILVEAYYQNVNTGVVYRYLNEALNDVLYNQTIRVLKDATETTAATLASGKNNIKLDLNGKNLTINARPGLVNNGGLTIYNSSDTDGKLYFYDVSANGGINNFGQLTLNDSNSTGKVEIYRTNNDSVYDNYNLIKNNTAATLTINNNTYIYRGNYVRTITNQGTVVMNGGSISLDYAIINTGTFTINGGSISSSGSNFNNTNGIIILNDGTIQSDGTAANALISGGSLTVNGGILTSNNTCFTTSVSGSFNMSGGSINSNTDRAVILSDSSAISTISAGSITARNYYSAILLSSGTLNLGTNDSTVSTEYPLIIANGSPAYGIQINSGTFNFYDGIIKSNGEGSHALSRNPDNTPTGYEVFNEYVSPYQTAYLALMRYATFYYNSNNTLGGFTPATITTYCEVTSGSSCTITVPTEVTNSVGKYNSAYKGVSTSSGNMSSSSLTISANTTYYANYQTSVTNYYYNSSYTSRTLYRNEFFTSNSEMNTVLSTGNTGTINYTASTGPNNSLWAGLNHAQSATVEYDSVQAAANGDATTLYTVYRYNVTYQKGANVDSIGSDSGYCLMTSSDTTCGVILPSITPTSGYASVGWNTTSGATSGTAALSTYMLNSNGKTLYANAIMPMLMAGDFGGVTTNYLRTNVQKQNIEKITFATSISGHTANGTDCFDVSKDQDGYVLAWVTDTNNNSKYEVTIGQNGGIIASSGYYLFYNLTDLNSIENIDYLDTSNVTNMSYMFCRTGYNSTTFALNLGNNFDTSNVTDMSSMFSYTGYSSTAFILNLGSKFDTSNVTNMSSMFQITGYRSTAFTLDLGDKFDTSNVTNMTQMFYSTGYSCTAFTLDLGDKFDTSNVTNMSSMFCYTGRNSIVFTLDLGDKFDTSNVTRMNSMFSSIGSNNTNFTLNLGDKFDTSNVISMYSMFSGVGHASTVFTLDLGDKFDTSNVTNMESMFYQTGYSSTTFTLDLGYKFDTSNVTSMNSMFNSMGYSSTNFELNLRDKFDTSNVTNMNYMFANLGNYSTTFTLNLGDKFDTSKVTSMKYMFFQTYITSLLDLGNKFDTSNVTDMEYMFGSTGSKSTTFNLVLGSKFNTSKVINMSSMFYNTGRISTVFILNLGSDFDTSNVTNMNYMFAYTGYSNPNFTLNLGSKFNTSSVTTMNNMFYYSRYLKTIYAPSSFVTTNVTSSTDMFSNCTSLVGGAGTVYSTSHTDASYAHIDRGTPNPGYFTLVS